MNINLVKMQLIKGARPYQKIVGALLKTIMPTLWRKNESDASKKKAYHWAVRQVLDKNYGLFKSQLRQNIQTLTPFTQKVTLWNSVGWE